MKKKKIVFICVAVLAVPIVTFLSLTIHELCHAIVLLISGGKLSEFSVSQLSFVSGNVPFDSVAPIAMAPLIIQPLLTLFSLINYKNIEKQRLHCWIWMLFGVSPLVNTLFNFFAYFFVKESKDIMLWDFLLALNYSNQAIHPLLFMILLIGLTISIVSMIHCFRKLYKSYL